MTGREACERLMAARRAGQGHPRLDDPPRPAAGGHRGRRRLRRRPAGRGARNFLRPIMGPPLDSNGRPHGRQVQGDEVERVEAGHLVVGEGEPEDVQVLGDPLRRDRLRDDHDVVLQVPAQHHLGRRRAVGGGDLGQHRRAHVTALERAVALEHDAALAVLGQALRRVLPRAPRDLVHRRRDSRSLVLISSSWSVLKLLTPIARARPSSRAAMNCSQVDDQAARVGRPVDQPEVDRGRRRARAGWPRACARTRPARSGGSLVVTKTSSRGTPLSRSARPTSPSLPYMVAVSMWR